MVSCVVFGTLVVVPDVLVFPFPDLVVEGLVCADVEVDVDVDVDVDVGADADADADAVGVGSVSQMPNTRECD